MKLVRTWYRSLLAEDHSLWCESSDPAEVLQLSKGREVILEKHETYEVTSGWGKWDGSV
jgi:hypothetical protein